MPALKTKKIPIRILGIKAEPKNKKETRIVAAKKSLATKTASRLFKNLEKSAEVAQYYGFTVIAAPEIIKDDHSKVRNMLEIDLSKQDGVDEHHLAIKPEEKVSLLRNYLERGMHTWSQPVQLYYESKGSGKAAKNFNTFHLDILGTTKSIAEATLIKTAYEILRDEGYKDLIVHINSVGDRDSMTRFCRELSNYYRKNIETLTPHCRQLLKRDPYEVYECKNSACQAIKENAPIPMSYLTEPSRQHFREVLEYLETLAIPYKIDNTLVCSKKMWSQTAFEIRDASEITEIIEPVKISKLIKVEKIEPAAMDSTIALDAADTYGVASPIDAASVAGTSITDTIAPVAPIVSIAPKQKEADPKGATHTVSAGTLLAVGMRYNGIAKKIGFRKELGAIGVIVSYKKLRTAKKTPSKTLKTPKVYFIQLSFDAKLKSLQVIEMLRQAKIPLAQSLGKDKLGGQIQSAENSNIPYTIIMGQKEAHDNTVIVRAMDTRSQEIISLPNLPEYLKKIK